MELLTYTIPALVALLAVYLFLNRFFKNESERRELELKKTNLQVVTPTRLRAYERLALLLERINPNNMLVSKIESAGTCIEFQGTILSEIRREFEYNTSQQVYVSEELWNEITDARNNLIQLVNVAAAQCKPDEQAAKLAAIIIEAYNTPEETALDAALHMLKEEIKRLL